MSRRSVQGRALGGVGRQAFPLHLGASAQAAGARVPRQGGAELHEPGRGGGGLAVKLLSPAHIV